jgi:hypothetical protein
MLKEYMHQINILNVGHGDSSVIYLMNDKREIVHTIVIDIPDSKKLLYEMKKIVLEWWI